jgi:hypothetical protein
MVSGNGGVIQFDRPLQLKTVDEVAQWAEAQFRVIERVFNEGAIYVRLVPLNAEPPKPRNGMVVYADGSDWDPDGGADGPGVFAYVNGAWERLDV